MKKLFSAMQFVDGDLSRKPRNVAKLLPRGPIKTFTAAIRAHHKPIAHLLNGLIGHKVSFRESQVMVDLLLRLQRLGVVALPIHDAVVVAKADEQVTRTTMLQVFHDHMGLEGVVEVESVRAPQPVEMAYS